MRVEGGWGGGQNAADFQGCTCNANSHAEKKLFKLTILYFQLSSYMYV